MACEVEEVGNDTHTPVFRPRKVRRHVTLPNNSLEMARSREETKLVVLDFLSALPPEKLTARNYKRAQSITPGLLENVTTPGLSKSWSDAQDYEMNLRHKFMTMAKPLRRQLSQTFQGESPVVASTDQNEALEAEAAPSVIEAVPAERPKTLDIPTSDRVHKKSPVVSPEGIVAQRLERISMEIMRAFPNILDGPIDALGSDSFTYEKFSAAARKVLDHRLVGWSKVALLCYFAREIALEGQMSDEQLEQLAEFSSRFIEETSSEWIANQGGWGALQKEDEDQVDAALQAIKNSPKRNSYNQWQLWTKFAIAIVAVGMGVCYSMFMTRN